MITNNTLIDKNIVITGATSGIGRAATRSLAAKGANVIGVGRSAARCEEAKEAVLTEFPEARITYLVADLSSQQAVWGLADQIKGLFEEPQDARIDVLVNNAGTVSSWYTTTEDGYELQFAVNHLAPFLLTHALLPLLEAAPQGRVITTSSNSHRGMGIRWNDVMNRRGYHCLRAYKQSKLANVLFTYELNRRMVDSGWRVRAFAVDPGLVKTEIGFKGTVGIEKWVWNWRANGGASPEHGAETVIYLASADTIAETQIAYWKECQPKLPSRYAQQPHAAARLWALSEQLCGIETQGAVVS